MHQVSSVTVTLSHFIGELVDCDFGVVCHDLYGVSQESVFFAFSFHIIDGLLISGMQRHSHDSWLSPTEKLHEGQLLVGKWVVRFCLLDGVSSHKYDTSAELCDVNEGRIFAFDAGSFAAILGPLILGI